MQYLDEMALWIGRGVIGLSGVSVALLVGGYLWQKFVEAMAEAYYAKRRQTTHPNTTERHDLAGEK